VTKAKSLDQAESESELLYYAAKVFVVCCCVIMRQIPEAGDLDALYLTYVSPQTTWCFAGWTESIHGVTKPQPEAVMTTRCA
jgi:hypothetical protein